jgi:signal transduction histidine kinase/ActR/RegA family two-component response regulator
MLFDPNLTLPAMILQSFYSGILIIGCLFFVFLFIRTGRKLHLSILLIGLAGLVFVVSDIMVLLAAWISNASFGRVFHAIQAFVSLYFIFGLPFMVEHLLEMNNKLYQWNRFYRNIGIIIAIGFLIAGIAFPDLYVSLTEHRGSWLENPWHYGRGVTGILYTLRDAWIINLFIFTFVSLLVDMRINRSYRYTILPLVGIILAMMGGVDDIIYVYKRIRLTPFPDVYYSRYATGLTLFIVLTMIAVIIKVIDQARDMEKASKIKSLGVFAGGIAHDFNNLLTGILGNISLANKMIESESQVSAILTDAEKATLRAKGLTQQLLTFARGGVPIKQRASIREFLTDSVNFVLRGSRVKGEFSFAHDLWDVEIDEDQMNQVINNLVINAVQAMPNGGKITITAGNRIITAQNNERLKKGNYVVVSIIDDGTGIPERQLKNIFDPYFTTKETGSGLGLAVCYSIIKKHAGHIDVDSKPGSGTTFTLYLPASKKGKTVKIKDDAENATITFSGRVLLMDDEDIIRRVGSRMLEELGFEVLAVQDGSEALEAYTREEEAGRAFRLVILDLTIPGGMDGRKALEQIRERYPEVRAIASSGYSNDPVLARFQDYGFSGKLTKPYRIDDLRDAVLRVLSG